MGLLLGWAGQRRGNIAHQGACPIGADNQHMADEGPGADQGMGGVVAVGRRSLAGSAKVGVGIDSALEAGATDAHCVLVLGADGAVAVDARVQDIGVAHRLVERGHILVDGGHEAVAGVDFGGQPNAAGTVVPVGTVDALVADAVDVAVALKKSGVTDVATGGEEGQDAADRLDALKDQGKRMARIVAMWTPLAVQVSQRS